MTSARSTRNGRQRRTSVRAASRSSSTRTSVFTSSAKNRAELPAVGDWVVVRQRAEEDGAVIVAVLPRRSAFTRRGAGNVTGEQVVAANVDVVFVVMGLDADFNQRRLERYLLMARESGAS